MDTNTLAAVICFLLLSVDGVISSPPEGGFCPERCDCQHAQQLLCANRGLRRVPKVAPQLPEEVLVFSLGGNFIGNISSLDFAQFRNLIRLNLQYNQIRTIHVNAFEKLSGLEELYLGHNLLPAIPPGTLQPLRKLTILYSNNNGIRRITAENFANLDSLVKLRLDGNAIEHLQDSVFKSLTNLHYLHLESNQLDHIHRNAFSKLSNLRFLNLAHNKQSALRDVFLFSQLRALTTLLLSENEIQHVGNHVFQNLKKLSQLSLSNNKISRVDIGALRGLSAVRQLLIDGNELTEIPARLLDPLQRLEELDFSRNQISKVHATAFSQLKRLKVLKLKDNRLASLSGDIFALNNVLYDLDLHGNNWTCDCRLEELKRWMTSAHAQGKLLSGFVQCRYPPTLRGRYLDDVNSSQLEPLGNWTRLCESQAGPAESRRGEVQEKELGDWERRDGDGAPQGEAGSESREGQDEEEGIGGGEVEERVAVDLDVTGEVDGEGGLTREGEMKKRKREKDEGIQGDQGGPNVADTSPSPQRKKLKKAVVSPRSRPAVDTALRRVKGKRKSNTNERTDPPPSFTPITPAYSDNKDRPSYGAVTQLTTSSTGEQFDLLRSDQGEAPPIITDPCVFNRHFITNVSVDHVTTSTATIHWTTRDHQRHTPGLRTGLDEVHFRVLFDRFGTADRFPRYVYARGMARSVTLRELSSDVTYMVCVEGVVGGSVCQVAPRDHCAGLVTLPERQSRVGGLTSDLELITVVTLAGNAILLLLIGGVWLGRSLRRRLQRRKSAVHVRHMYSTRRPFRSAMATAAASTDFTSYQSSRPARLATLKEGDLIEFPCDRFLDNSAALRESDMQRFSD